MTGLLLGLDGALGDFSAAVGDGAPLAQSLDGTHALEGGLGLIQDVLEASGHALTNLDGVAVGTGPGRFTGLRIAVSFAKALALGARLPLVGVSSFDILDESVGAEGRTPRLTIVSGRPGVICARRIDGSGARTACGPVSSALARLVEPAEKTLTVIGATEDVLVALGERASSVLILPPSGENAAVALLRVARLRRPLESAHALRADYGELPAARAPS